MNTVLLALIALMMIAVFTMSLLTLFVIRAIYSLMNDVDEAMEVLYTKITGKPYTGLERKHES